MGRPLVGFLPAAGRGTRFGSSGYVKELYPIFTSRAPDAEPQPIAALSLAAMARAGAARGVVLVSPAKAEVMRVLGAAPGGLPVAYVVQPEPRGLPHGLRCARPWLDGADVLFAMPDTLTRPVDALKELAEIRAKEDLDVVLGVFPAEEAERLGPVEMDAAGQIVAVHDKPGHRRWPNTWGMAAWSPAFTTFACEWDQARDDKAAGERVIGHVFEAARTAGMRVAAHSFVTGLFLDIGTPGGLNAALAILARNE